jgi:hypothetical protein
MMKSSRPRPGGIGRLSVRPPSDEGPIPKTLAFLRGCLPAWRDDPERPKNSSEVELNSSLCTFLDVRAKIELPLIRFHHEDLQGTIHSVDIGVRSAQGPLSIEARTYSIYEPFLLIECKRLPADRRSREREYVSGSRNDAATGGIQRFKLGIHGAKVTTVAIVGYVQKETLQFWHASINAWISELASDSLTNTCEWLSSETLGNLDVNEAKGISVCESDHPRIQSLSPTIRVHHFWICMFETGS